MLWRQTESAPRSSEVEFNPADPARSEIHHVLYILSPSYSGSTLLTFLWASHPDIATVGELKASAMGDLETYRCSCGSLLKECCFWKQVQHEMQRRGADLSLDDFGTHFNNGTAIFRRLTRLGVKHPLFATLSSLALETLPPLRVQLTKIVEQNRLLIEVISGIQRGRVFLDGSKDPERLNQFLNSSHWNVKVVRLIRDGRGVTNSYRKHYQVSMEEAAREWVATERACARVAALLTPTDVLTVKYEDFCEKPQEILLRIVRFVGLDPA